MTARDLDMLQRSAYDTVSLSGEAGLRSITPSGINTSLSVGTPAGSFAVSPMGGATYSIPIDVPAGIENPLGAVDLPSDYVSVSYNELGKAATVTDGGNPYITYHYGPDHERWRGVQHQGGSTWSNLYFGDYEERYVNANSRRCFVYLDGGVLAVSNNGGSYQFYYIHTDHQGSILAITDAQGSYVFKASYDAWGRQAVTVNTLAFQRGYTGHEMMREGGLINMNGRIYDSALGLFLSPDNYVQEPLNSQNFNRYSYCLNNPLKYVDPDGEWIHLLIGGIIGGVTNWIAHGCKLNAKGLGGFLVGAMAGSIGTGIGMGISSALPIAGQASGGFAAGFWGTSLATTATSSFVSGALVGGGAGFSSGFLLGFGNDLLDGKGFGRSLGYGLRDGLIGGFSGAAVGGLWSGFDAMLDGRRFWDGATVQTNYVIEQNIPIVAQEGAHNCLPACAESVDKSFGGNITQQDIRNVLGGDPSLDDLTDKTVWDVYGKISGHTNEFLRATNQNLVESMQSGNRIAINLELGGDQGHCVIMQKIIEQTIYKPNGKISAPKMLFFVMDPAKGGYYHRVSLNSLLKARNIFCIFPK